MVNLFITTFKSFSRSIQYRLAKMLNTLNAEVMFECLANIYLCTMFISSTVHNVLPLPARYLDSYARI